MFITGYHGTNLENARRIINEKQFIISNSDKDWLASGIYFYHNFSDAYEWRNSQAILHCVIKIDESEFLDIDSPEGRILFHNMAMYLAKFQNKKHNTELKYAQSNQYSLMKMLWDSYPKIKVISASFPASQTVFRTLLDMRITRKEFCVRDNNYIKYINLIGKDDLGD